MLLFLPTESARIRILFVCMGNICRSPTAEGVMRHLVADAGLAEVIDVDSAGTGGWHVGEPPDRRSSAAAKRYGVTLAGTARKVATEDFDDFDLVLPVDESTFYDLRAIQPEGSSAQLTKFADYAGQDVPDPYYGGEDGFDEVYQIVASGCGVLLDQIRAQLDG